MRKIILAMALTCCAILSSSLAQAACAQNNGRGTWRVYSSAIDSGNVYWVKGSIVVSSSGRISAGQNFTDPHGEYRTLQSGNVRISRNCQVTGDFVYTDGYQISINEGWMVNDKSFINGVWTDGYGNNGTFTATKY